MPKRHDPSLLLLHTLRPVLLLHVCDVWPRFWKRNHIDKILHIASLMFTYVIHPRDPTHSQVTPPDTNQSPRGWQRLCKPNPSRHLGTYCRKGQCGHIVWDEGETNQKMFLAMWACKYERVGYLLNLASVYHAAPVPLHLQQKS